MLFFPWKKRKSAPQKLWKGRRKSDDTARNLQLQDAKSIPETEAGNVLHVANQNTDPKPSADEMPMMQTSTIDGAMRNMFLRRSLSFRNLRQKE